MSLTRPSLLDTVFFRTALPCSGGYHMERGGMSLHDAVGINCKKGATTEIQTQLSSIWAKGYILMTVCVFYLTWHDYPSLVQGESHGILLLLLLLLKIVTIFFIHFLIFFKKQIKIKIKNLSSARCSEYIIILSRIIFFFFF